MNFKLCPECGQKNDLNAARCNMCELAFEGEIEETRPKYSSNAINEPPKLEPLNHDPAVWFYTSKGQRYGPISEYELIRINQKNQLDNDCLVWKQGLADWTLINTIPNFTKYNSTPPPLLGDAISNTIVWWLAFVPIIGLIIEYYISSFTDAQINDLWYITVILNVSLCVIDQHMLKRNGHYISSFSWVFLVPIYLFIRAKKLKQKYFYPTIWIICFIVSVFIPNQILNFIPQTDQQYVSIVKNGHFNDYSNVSIRDAFNHYFNNTKWEAITGQDGNKYVNFNGDTIKQKLNITIQFEFINNDTNFLVHSVMANGQTMNQQLINDFIKEIYSIN